MFDWSALRAEYVSGGISLRQLAKKHGVNVNSLMNRATKDGWKKSRDETERKALTMAQQKAANAAAENVATAERIKAKLLRQLEKEIDALPDNIGTETKKTIIDNRFGGKEDGKKTAAYGQVTHSEELTRAYSLRDLTAAYKNLTSDMPKDSGAEPVRIIVDV